MKTHGGRAAPLLLLEQFAKENHRVCRLSRFCLWCSQLSSREDNPHGFIWSNQIDVPGDARRQRHGPALTKTNAFGLRVLQPSSLQAYLFRRGNAVSRFSSSTLIGRRAEGLAHRRIVRQHVPVLVIHTLNRNPRSGRNIMENQCLSGALPRAGVGAQPDSTRQSPIPHTGGLCHNDIL